MKIFAFVFLVVSYNAIAQQDSIQAVNDVLSFQKEINDEYKDKSKSPLEPKDFRKFKGLPFFPINLRYRVMAKLVLTPGTPFLPLKTTTARLANDRIYGYVEFSIEGKPFRLPVYQSQDLMKKPDLADYLFFPFTDLTNGEQTYPGGRYIDLRIPKDGDEILVDFNKAYNPYCAYSHRFSCPLVPRENHMDIEVLAGVMHTDTKHKEKR